MIRVYLFHLREGQKQDPEQLDNVVHLLDQDPDVLGYRHASPFILIVRSSRELGNDLSNILPKYKVLTISGNSLSDMMHAVQSLPGQKDTQVPRSQPSRANDEVVDFSHLVIDPDQVPSLESLLLPQPVFDQVSRLLIRQRFNAHAQTQGRILDDSLQNMLISGPPGVGKSTLAMTIATACVEARNSLYLSDRLEEVYLVKPSDVTGKYAGHTPRNLQDLFDQAGRGIVIFDEVDTFADIARFGPEALNTINTHITNHPNAPQIIATLYAERTHEFFAANRGLESRFRYRVNIPGQSDTDLVTVFSNTLEKRGMHIEPGVTESVAALIKQMRNAEGRNFGHFRSVTNVIDFIMDNMAGRWDATGCPQNFDYTVKTCDVPRRDMKSGNLVVPQTTPASQRRTPQTVVPFEKLPS